MTTMDAAAGAATLEDRVAHYRAQAAHVGATQRLEALEKSYDERRRRLRQADPDSWLICDHGIFQEALAYAATPAAVEDEGLQKLGWLIPYACMDASFLKQRRVGAMLDAALRVESERWGFPMRAPAAA